MLEPIFCTGMISNPRASRCPPRCCLELSFFGGPEKVFPKHYVLEMLLVIGRLGFPTLLCLEVARLAYHPGTRSYPITMLGGFAFRVLLPGRQDNVRILSNMSLLEGSLASGPSMRVCTPLLSSASPPLNLCSRPSFSSVFCLSYHGSLFFPYPAVGRKRCWEFRGGTLLFDGSSPRPLLAFLSKSSPARGC